MNEEAKPERECGSCYLCCMVYRVEELNKPATIRCQHSTEHGCQIHGDPSRPRICRDFKCLWLLGYLDEASRPDKVHIVCRGRRYGSLAIMHIMEEFPHAAESITVRQIIEHFRESGYGVILQDGPVGKGITPTGLSPKEKKAYLDEILAAAEKLGGEFTILKKDERFES